MTPPRAPGSIATSREACEQLASDLWVQHGVVIVLEWQSRLWAWPERGRARVEGFDLTNWLSPKELGLYLTGFTDAMSVKETQC